MAHLYREAARILEQRLREAGLNDPLRMVRLDNGDGTVTILAADAKNVPLPDIEGVAGSLTVCDYPIPEAAIPPPPGRMYMIP